MNFKDQNGNVIREGDCVLTPLGTGFAGILKSGLRAIQLDGGNVVLLGNIKVWRIE